MKISARIDLPHDAIGPDPWDENNGVSLPLNHVICRSEKGAPHFVREFVWPWTAYHPRKKRSLLHFHYWKTNEDRTKIRPSDITPAREARIRELQFLMVKIIYSGRNIGFESLQHKLRCLHRIARFAESKNCTVRDVLAQQPLLDAFIGITAGQLASVLRTWLTFLGNLNPERELGFALARPKRWQELQRRVWSDAGNVKQYAPLPSRIYAGLINNLRAELDDIEAHADHLLRALKEAIHLYQTTKEIDGVVAIGPQLIHQYGLAEFLERRGIDLSLKGLTKAVNETFLLCKMEIHVFSGMRHEECQTLPFYCMVTEKFSHSRTHCLIAGVTTKLEGSRRRRTKWVTTEHEGFRAIRLAQRFAREIYNYLGITPSTAERSKDDTPLFPSPNYLPWKINNSRLPVDKITPAALILRSGDTLPKRLCPIIEDADIKELEEIDPFRSWREESEFAIGSRWPLTPHQLRRSLALYANASGLVRLSSLRRQLQHISREMSLYYGRGSTFCKNFIAENPDGFKKHIALEWQDGIEEAKALSFTLDVLNSNEPLYGGAGIYYERQRARGEILKREEVHKQFKEGRLNYNSGPLGGCTKPGNCNTRKGLNLVDTLCATDNCKHLVGKHSKIIQVIRLKHAYLTRMNKNSIDYAMEKEELESLEKVEMLWRPPQSPDATSRRDTHD